ncbi:MAG: Flp family type IVb pilin [Pirellulales bacterium]|nr:Flp family type IVb pilin [Pirellulales bacterium]
MRSIFNKIQNFLRQEDGPTAAEYAIMLGLIIMVCLIAVFTVGQQTNTSFSNSSASVSAAVSGS